MASGRIDDLRRLAFHGNALPFAVIGRCDGGPLGVNEIDGGDTIRDDTAV